MAINLFTKLQLAREIIAISDELGIERPHFVTPKNLAGSMSTTELRQHLKSMRDARQFKILKK